MIFVLPILVLLVAVTRPRGQAPSPTKKRQRKAQAAAPKILYATDIFTHRTHEFSGPGAYAECRNMNVRRNIASASGHSTGAGRPRFAATPSRA